MLNDAELQKDYYTRTAAEYDEVRSFEDRDFALTVDTFISFARRHDARSIIEIGSGTGRAIARFREWNAGLNVVGIEPVAALRDVAVNKGVPADVIREGNALSLEYRTIRSTLQ